MVHHPVRQGYIAENRSSVEGLFLIQVSDKISEARIVLTPEQVREHIERLNTLLNSQPSSGYNPARKD
jgi:hypothetical protein